MLLLQRCCSSNGVYGTITKNDDDYSKNDDPDNENDNVTNDNNENSDSSSNSSSNSKCGIYIAPNKEGSMSFYSGNNHGMLLIDELMILIYDANKE